MSRTRPPLPRYVLEHRTDMPPNAITWLMLVAMMLGFMLQDANGRAFEMRFALWPLGTELRAPGGRETFGFAPWQLLSYAFLHADYWHLLLNALALWLFGRGVEAVVGVGRYTAFLALTIAGSGVAQLCTLALTAPGEATATIGASGAGYAVLFGYGYLFPRHRPLPWLGLPAWLLVSAFAALELYRGLSRPESSVAHFVHLGGMLFAWLLLRYWFRRGAIRMLPPELPDPLLAAAHAEPYRPNHADESR